MSETEQSAESVEETDAIEGAESSEATEPSDAVDDADTTEAQDAEMVAEGAGDDADEPAETGSATSLEERLEQEGDIAADYLEELLDIADLDGDLDMDVEGERAVVSIVGADLSQLVGANGEVLDALQELIESDPGYTERITGYPPGPADAQSFTIWPQPGGHRMGFNLLNGPNGFNVDNLTIDHWSATALVVQNNQVFYYDFSDAAPTSVVYTWRSKKFQQNARKNFSAMRVKFTIPAGTPNLNPTRLQNDTNDPVWNTLPADRYGFIRVFAGDDVLITVREIRKVQELLRILGDTKHETWYFEITARVPIENVQIGTSVKALAKV